MTKDELVEKVAAQTGLTKKSAREVVEIVYETMTSRTKKKPKPVVTYEVTYEVEWDRSSNEWMVVRHDLRSLGACKRYIAGLIPSARPKTRIVRVTREVVE